jgi:hypothetical protein
MAEMCLVCSSFCSSIVLRSDLTKPVSTLICAFALVFVVSCVTWFGVAVIVAGRSPAFAMRALTFVATMRSLRCELTSGRFA